MRSETSIACSPLELLRNQPAPFCSGTFSGGSTDSPATATIAHPADLFELSEAINIDELFSSLPLDSGVGLFRATHGDHRSSALSEIFNNLEGLGKIP